MPHNSKCQAFINPDDHVSPSAPSCKVIEENLILVLKISYDSSSISKLKPMNRIDGTDVKSKLLEFLVGNIPDESIKA